MDNERLQSSSLEDQQTLMLQRSSPLVSEPIPDAAPAVEGTVLLDASEAMAALAARDGEERTEPAAPDGTLMLDRASGDPEVAPGGTLHLDGLSALPSDHGRERVSAVQSGGTMVASSGAPPSSLPSTPPPGGTVLATSAPHAVSGGSSRRTSVRIQHSSGVPGWLVVGIIAAAAGIVVGSML